MNTTNVLLPDLKEPIQIHEDQIKEFREKGHTLIRNILSKEEVNIYRDVIVNAADRFNTEKRKQVCMVICSSRNEFYFHLYVF